MNCVILQPSYIPWRGYFHQIQKADLFIYYDDVQYDKHGWRNRNKIKTSQGLKWLTIPVLSKGNTVDGIPINQIEIDWRENWPRKHWESIRQNYSKAPHFKKYAALLEPFYQQHPLLLADFTIETTTALTRMLGNDKTQFIRSSTIPATGTKTGRLVQILTHVGARHYVSGPSAKDYLEEDKLRAAGISVEWMQYNYPEYEQLYPPYEAGVSIVDLLFMKGAEASKYIY